MKKLLYLFGCVLFTGLFLSRCNSHYEVSSTEGDYTTIDSALNSSDKDLEELIEPYSASLEEKMNEVLNTADHSMIKARPEGLLSNFVADLLFEEVNEIDGISADFCLINHGGLRSSLPEGNITVGDIFQLMPFENETVILEVSGEKIAEIASYLKFRGGEPVSNFKLSFSDLDNITIGGKPADPAKSYRIITSDYLAKGGDKMDFFKDPISYIKTGFKIRDLIIEHIREEKQLGNTLNSALDGRLSE